MQYTHYNFELKLLKEYLEIYIQLLPYYVSRRKTIINKLKQKLKIMQTTVINDGVSITKDFSQMSLMERDKFWREAEKEQSLQLKQEKAQLHKHNEKLKIKLAKANFKAECKRMGKDPNNWKTIVSTEITEAGVWNKK